MNLPHFHKNTHNNFIWLNKLKTTPLASRATLGHTHRNATAMKD